MAAFQSGGGRELAHDGPCVLNEDKKLGYRYFVGPISSLTHDMRCAEFLLPPVVG